MKKIYKLAVLGCTASCLMNAAYANTADAEVFPGADLGISSPGFQAVACDAPARDVPVTLTNNLKFRPIAIQKANVIDIIGQDVGVDITVDASACEVLRGGESCVATVTVDPSNAECGPLGYIDYEQIISRLVVSYKTWSPFEETASDLPASHAQYASLPIRFPVTILGSAGDYSIIGGAIQIGSDEQVNALDNSVTTVEQDITAGKDYINVANGSYINYMDDSEYVKYDNGGSNAFLDAITAYENFTQIVLGDEPLSFLDEGVQCDGVAQTFDFSGYSSDTTIPSGFYCAIGNPNTDGEGNTIITYSLKDKYTFIGDKGDPVVIVFPEYSDVDTYIEIDGASYELDNNGGISLPISFENIFWLFGGDAEIETGSTFVGSILTIGEFGSLATDDSDGGYGTPYVYGRLLGLYGDDDCCSDTYDSEIYLDGITFDDGSIL